MSEDTLGFLISRALISVVQGRTFPGQAPDAPTTPYVVWFYFGDELMTLTTRANLQRRLVQLDIYDKRYMDAEAAADQIRDVFEVLTHLGSPPSFTAVPQSRSFAVPDPDVKLHRVTLEYSVWYRPGA